MRGQADRSKHMHAEGSQLITLLRFVQGEREHDVHEQRSSSPSILLEARGGGPRSRSRTTRWRMRPRPFSHSHTPTLPHSHTDTLAHAWSLSLSSSSHRGQRSPPLLAYASAPELLRKLSKRVCASACAGRGVRDCRAKSKGGTIDQSIQPCPAHTRANPRTRI